MLYVGATRALPVINKQTVVPWKGGSGLGGYLGLEHGSGCQDLSDFWSIFELTTQIHCADRDVPSPVTNPLST